MGFQSQIQEALNTLEKTGLRRYPPTIAGAQGPVVRVAGREVLCFCSNNYLGLAGHPQVQAAVRAALQAEGCGSGASRLISGTMNVHREAEAALAGFVGQPDAVLFSAGYAANVGTLQALLGPEDAVFSDALNHASLIDGCRLSRARVHVYRHGDADHLAELLASHRQKARRALVLTDSLFSMDGDVAPLPRLAELAEEHEAGLMVDEAHALGVLGPEGRGLAAAEGVHPDLLVGTLGKSFGVAGAFVAASESMTAFLRNRARSFVYSTAPSPMLVRAALAALPLVRDAEDRRARLVRHASRMRRELRQLGFDVPLGAGPIVPVILGDNRRTMELSEALLERGVFVQGIRPPTVAPGTARLRLTAMATHDEAHIDRAIEAFAETVRRS
jgi:8-amino-7-oxononanoate synthase